MNIGITIYIKEMISVKTTITPIKIEKFNDPEIDKFLPKFTKQHCRTEIKNVLPSVANGIRRILVNDLEIKCMNVLEMETDDPFLRETREDVVEKRIRLLPIQQSVNPSAKFSLSVHNTDYRQAIILSDALTEDSGKTNLFETNTCLFVLQPGCKITLKVGIISGRKKGYFLPTVASSCTPLDVDPSKTSVSTSNPREHLIKFDTNGTITPISLLRRACDEFIIRCQSAKNGKLIANTDHYKFRLYSENHTVANAIIQLVCEEYPMAKSTTTSTVNAPDTTTGTTSTTTGSTTSTTTGTTTTGSTTSPKNILKYITYECREHEIYSDIIINVVGDPKKIIFAALDKIIACLEQMKTFYKE